MKLGILQDHILAKDRRLDLSLLSHKGAPAQTSTKITAIVLARNEDRVIGRCLSSLTTEAVDRVVVIDTGSTDNTLRIARGFPEHHVTVTRIDWPGNFAAARNTALEMIGKGWVVFIDADEWLTPAAAEYMRPVLWEASSLENAHEIGLRPTIVEQDGGRSIAPSRMLLADGRVRFSGAVHEEPRLSGEKSAHPCWIALDLEFRHDGYRPDVVESKEKQKRNARLIEKCLEDEPWNPRWLYFKIRDQIDILSLAEIQRLWEELSEAWKGLAGRGLPPPLEDYYGLGLRAYCQRLAAERRLDELAKTCENLESHLPGNCDSFYYRNVLDFIEADRRMGEVQDIAGRLNDLLLRVVRYRRNMPEVVGDSLHASGTHLDALIAALLEALGRPEEADRYRSTITGVWSDGLFVNNRPAWQV